MLRFLGHRTEFVNNELNITEGLMHNLLEDNMSISERKKLLYTGFVYGFRDIRANEKKGKTLAYIEI